MNITLSTDEETLKRTRAYAIKHGTSVNQLVRGFLRSLTRHEARDEMTDEFLRNATEHSGRSPEGFRFDREDAHRRPD